jgi:hypothetical protein
MLRIGQTVRIRTDLHEASPGEYGQVNVVPEMLAYRGMTGTIRHTSISERYHLDIDEGAYVWTESMFVNEGAIPAPSTRHHKQYVVLSGWELECIDIAIPTADNTETRAQWADITAHNIFVTHDGSVRGRGLELIIKEPKPCRETLETLQWLIDTYSPRVDKSCGLHFHFSVQEKTETGLRNISAYEKSKLVNNLFALCSMFEDVIFPLFPFSRQSNSFCARFREIYARKNVTVRQKLGHISPSKTSNQTRYCWLNMVEMYRPGGHGTVEFRLLGNTVRMEYIADVALMFQFLVTQSFTMNLIKNPDALTDITQRMNDNIVREIKRVQHIEDMDLRGESLKSYTKMVIAKVGEMQKISTEN